MKKTPKTDIEEMDCEASNITDRLKMAARLQFAIEQALKSHEKEGTCYETTRLLLELYREFKFDKTQLKKMQTLETFKAYGHLDDINEDSLSIDLEYIISLPDNIAFCSNKIKSFIDSSEPATIGRFVYLVDCGLETLSTNNEIFSKLLKFTYLEKPMSPKDLYNSLGMSKSAYYREREKSISELSKIMFGTLGQRHKNSVFADEIPLPNSSKNTAS